MKTTGFDEMIHEERTKLLRLLPKGADVFCTAGCSGGWYFDWIEQEYGPVRLHYGVELFSPRPEKLPLNVRWIANSVATMTDVPSGSVDLLFSGQNIEHLYREDLLGFLHEANRVVRLGGHICLDSPNRTITQEARYRQPQHTLELSAPEAILLVEAAGFEIENVYGIWSCAGGLTRYDDVTKLSGNVDKRRAEARDDPFSSFIWWIVARKVGEASSTIASEVDAILLHKFPSFVATRFLNYGRSLVSVEGTDAIVQVGHNEHGFVFHGPYVPLRDGLWDASFDFKFLSNSGHLSFDVASGGGEVIHSKVSTAAGSIGEWQHIVLPFDLSTYTDAVEARVETHGAEAQIKFGAGIRRR